MVTLIFTQEISGKSVDGLREVKKSWAKDMSGSQGVAIRADPGWLEGHTLEELKKLKPQGKVLKTNIIPLPI